MPSAKCAHCGTVREFETLPKKFCCSKCGVLNTPIDEDTAGSGDQACGCLLPITPEWTLPAGVTTSADGTTLYHTADDGTGLTRVEWIEMKGVDPVVTLAKMRDLGENGVPGYVNLSTLGKKRKSK